MAANPLLASLNSAWLQIFPVVLNLVIALVLILLGYLIARGLAFCVTYILKLIRLDKGAKIIKFNTLLDKGEIKKSLSELLGDVVYWTLLFITIMVVAQVIGLKIEPALMKVFAYLGLAFVVAVILGVGLFFASLMAGIIKAVLLNFGVEGGKSLARFIYYLVVLFTFLAALTQLGLKPSSLLGKLDILLGAPALAAAIAFGLGCKDMAADFLYGIFKGK